VPKSTHESWCITAPKPIRGTNYKKIAEISQLQQIAMNIENAHNNSQ